MLILKQKIERSTLLNGATVDKGFHSDLVSIMDDHNTEIASYPPNSFLRVFWEQHYENIKKKDARQIRWHPAMVKWCLSLKLLSSSCYNAVRSSGIIKLPSERTLRDYVNWTKATIGLNHDVDQQLLTEAKLDSSPSSHRFVCLIFDECKVKEDLVYDKHSGEIIGYCDVNGINNYLDAVEKVNASTSPTRAIATHMIMFMVRGMFSSLKFPYVHYSTRALTGDKIFSLFWTVVERLESLGFSVLATTCDGAAPNRRFFKIHGNKHTYKIKNPYSKEDTPLYLISDTPHLLKTIRNCWANSYSHSWSRKLWVRHYISFTLHYPSTYRLMGKTLGGTPYFNYTISIACQVQVHLAYHYSLNFDTTTSI